MNDDRMTDDRVPLSLVVNGAPHEYHVRMHDSLLDVLRRESWTGAKRVCETADCGACSVLVDGTLVDSCSTLAFQAEGCKVVLTYPPTIGRLSPQRMDAWATELIEGAMSYLEGGPFEIDYRVGVIEFEYPGRTSYEI